MYHAENPLVRKVQRAGAENLFVRAQKGVVRTKRVPESSMRFRRIGSIFERREKKNDIGSFKDILMKRLEALKDEEHPRIRVSIPVFKKEKTRLETRIVTSRLIDAYA